MIGAVVIPVEDETCSSKFGDDGSLLYTIAERIKLWEDDHTFPSWACVLEEDAWDSIRPTLSSLAHDDGFNIAFLMVCGPDHVDDEDGSWMSNYHALNEILVSDTGKKADFNLASGMRDLDGCSTWIKSPMEEIAELNGTEDERPSRQQDFDPNGWLA